MTASLVLSIAAVALLVPRAAAGTDLPLRVHVEMGGRRVLPAAGSTAGLWFYADPEPGTQVLLTGHPSVPGSWRLTASLAPRDEVHLCFPPLGAGDEGFGFRSENLTGATAECGFRTNVLVITAGPDLTAVRITGMTHGDRPVALAPERRPFSRGPVVGSPDPHPAIAEAMVDWDWRLQDGIQTPREARSFAQATEQLRRRTGALIAERERRGTLPAKHAAAWKGFSEGELPRPDDPVAGESFWRALHRFRRELLLSDPLLRFPGLIFLKHVPSVMSHQLTQVYGYCARPGGGVFVLTEPGLSMRTRPLAESLEPGNFMTPELSFDGAKLLLAYCPVREAPAAWDYNAQTSPWRYHLYELTLATGAVRPLTRGDTDNFSPVCLPDGDVLFVSTRRGGFHRCGRGPCFVYTLARMGPDGQDPRTLSFHETHEWDPALLNDGRVVYTRWDYVDRNAVHYEQLWSALPDGSATRIFYGNNTWNPTGIWEARAIPGSTRIMATAGPHHGMSAGSILVLDTSLGVDGRGPITRVTPDVRFPESETPLAFGPNPSGYDFDTPVTQYWRSPFTEPGSETVAPEEEKRWPGHCYKSPWPLSETCFLVSYSFDQLVGEPGPNLPNMFGLYMADAFGNKELLYRDPAISSLWARPLAPRNPPPALARPAARADRDHGTFLVSNVTDGWPSLPDRVTIARLRVIQVLLKTTPHADTPRVGAAFAAPGKQVLGTVPVEADGSAYFEVPARTPVMFQALDDRGRAVQTMRSLVYLQPGENQSCGGCHEHRLRTAAPAPSRSLQALQRPASRIAPGPEGSRPFSYPRLVQPVLDRHCVRCHDGKEAGRPILTGDPEGAFTRSYNALVSLVAYSAWNRPDQNHEPLSEPLRFGTLGSPLRKRLEQAPCQAALSPEEEERLYTWMDANALFYGTFDPAEQQKQLAGELIGGPKE